MDHGRAASPSTTRLATGLFLSFFTAQAAFVVLAPMLPQVADNFGISVAAAGQLRTAAAVAGVLTAVGLIPLARRVSVGRLLRAGLLVLAAGSVASAAAPSFAVLVPGQFGLGAGAAAVLSAGLAAASEWPSADQRPNVLAWAIVGQPAAWVVGMPVVGALAGAGWRWGWLIVPTAAAAALVGVPREPERAKTAPHQSAGRRALRDGAVRRWAVGELMAYAGWGGTLVYAGALIGESYGLGADTVGLLLGAAAAAYFPGTFAARRRLQRDLRPLLAGLALSLAAGALAFGIFRPSAVASAALFAVLVLLAGGRGLAGSAYGLNAAPSHKLAIGSVRTAATQLGYLVGAAAGGIALHAGGYPALGILLASFFVAAALPHLTFASARRAAGSTRVALAPVPAGCD